MERGSSWLTELLCNKVSELKGYEIETVVRVGTGAPGRRLADSEAGVLDFPHLL